MSVIQKQGVRHSLVNYIGVAVSFLSTIFIYKLDLELYGFSQFLVNSAGFLAPFMIFGSTGMLLKYYPEFRQQNQEANIFKSIMVWFVISVIISGVILVLFQDWIFELLRFMRVDNKGIIDKYFYPILILAALIGLKKLLYVQSSNLYKIVFPEVVNNLLYKLFLPVIIVLGFLNWIHIDVVIWAILIFFFISIFLLMVYIRRKGGFSGKGVDMGALVASKKREIISFATFNWMGGISASLAFRVDMIMLSAMLGFSSNGVYALLLFISNVIDIPRKSLTRIINPVMATAFAENDSDRVQDLYRKASISLMVPSMFLFLLLWVLLPEFDKMAGGKGIFAPNWELFVLLGAGRLVDMVFSNNTEIIRYSQYYRLNLVFIIILALANVVLNYYFILAYGITGAALATFLAFVLYNVLKAAFLYLKFGYTPFDRGLVPLLILAALSVIFNHLIPDGIAWWMSAPLKIVIMFLVYALPAFYLKLSPEVNNLMIGYFKKGQIILKSFVNKS